MTRAVPGNDPGSPYDLAIHTEVIAEASALAVGWAALWKRFHAIRQLSRRHQAARRAARDPYLQDRVKLVDRSRDSVDEYLSRIQEKEEIL